MAIYMGNRSSSTSSFNPPQTSSDTNQTDSGLNSLISQCIIDVNSLKEEVKQIEKEQGKTSEFYLASTNLAKTSRIIMLGILAVPVIQLVLCVGIIYFLGIEKQLPGFLTWAISGVGTLSVIEVGQAIHKMNSFESKLDNIKERLDKLENT